MRIFIQVTTASIALCVLTMTLRAQDQAVRSESRKTIEIGQTIADAQGILRDHRVDFSEGGFALASTNDDESHFSCVLDKQNAYAAIFYSKSAKTVTGMSIVFFPTGNHAKSTEAWVPARSITLEDDGSYAVHFLPPVKPQQKRPTPKSEVPRSSNPPKRAP